MEPEITDRVRPRHWPFVALAIGHVLVLVLIHFLEPDPAGFTIFIFGLMYAAYFSQASLLGIWCAVGFQRLVLRLPVCVALLGLPWLGFLAFIKSINAGTTPDLMMIGVIWALALLVQWTLMQLPLWALRLRAGWRVDMPQRAATDAHEETQFGLRHLLAWMGGIAVLLGAGRLVLHDLSPTPQMIDWRPILAFSLLAGFNVLITLPIIPAALSSSKRWVWLPISLGICIGATLVEPATFEAVTGNRGLEWQFWWVLNGSYCASLAGSLLVIRFTGARLTKRHAVA